MSWPKGKPRHPGVGRKKGTPNKITAAVREMTLEALHLEGGIDYLRRLAREQPAVFGGLLRRCVPQAVEAKIEHARTVKIVDLSGCGVSSDGDHRE